MESLKGRKVVPWLCSLAWKGLKLEEEEEEGGGASACLVRRGTRVSCRWHSPHARGRPIKRMQIKTFYLNDNITLVDASALA
mgnify:CR=1 FL=1